MADTGRSWYTELDFDSYVLDLLLIGWCTICVVIIVTVNAIVSAFGPLQRQPQEKIRGEREGVSLSGTVLPVETAKWFNDAVSWFYLHYYYTPEYAEEWLKSLNDQLTKLGVSTCPCTSTQTHAQMRAHTYRHARAHTHMRACLYVCTHTHIQTHT